MTRLSIITLWLVASCHLSTSAGTGMPKLGSGGTASSAPSDVGGGGGGGDIPTALQGLQEMADRVDKAIAALESASDVSQRDVVFTRIQVVSFLTGINRGGTNAGVCTDCFHHPLHAQLKAKFPGFEARMAKLEKRYGQCTFGHQMADGKILALTIDWSYEQWMAITDKSKHQTARCWLDDDRSSYL